VDARSLVEAVYNLIDNAAKYSTAGSSIFIRAALSGENVRFEVEDEGPGVPTADREAVFERFSQGTVKKDGLGMGLAIVRGIIEAHGGRIWIESGKKGARFVFELPPDINGR
jgi:two-component system sensor histidine kinase KdpD